MRIFKGISCNIIGLIAIPVVFLILIFILDPATRFINSTLPEEIVWSAQWVEGIVIALVSIYIGVVLSIKLMIKFEVLKRETTTDKPQ